MTAKRQCYIKDDLCYIPLSNGDIAFTDAEYYDLVKKYLWSLSNGCVFTGYGTSKYMSLNQLLFPDITILRHINKNKLDYRKENLIDLKRKCYIKDNLCYIPLNNKKEAFTDKEHFDKVSKYTWSYSNGCIGRLANKKFIALSSFLFPEYDQGIRFINKNNLDYRKENITNIKRYCFVKDNICYIPLANGEYAICDANRFDEVNKHTWLKHFFGYVICNINKKIVRLHRYLYPEWKIIDHKNHDKLNNCSSNLREVTASQNSMNSYKQKTNKAGYKGVYFYKRDKKYRAQIVINGTGMCIGSFKTPEDAAEAYNKKAIELFGEYACLNIIPKKKKSIF